MLSFVFPQRWGREVCVWVTHFRILQTKLMSASWNSKSSVFCLIKCLSHHSFFFFHEINLGNISWLPLFSLWEQRLYLTWNERNHLFVVTDKKLSIRFALIVYSLGSYLIQGNFILFCFIFFFVKPEFSGYALVYTVKQTKVVDHNLYVLLSVIHN